MQYTCLLGCRLPPLDGYMAVCLILIIDVYGKEKHTIFTFQRAIDTERWNISARVCSFYVCLKKHQSIDIY